MKDLGKALSNIAYLGQLGLSLIMPLLLMLLLCYFLTHRFGIGGWVYIIGFVLGIGAGGMTAWKFYKVQEKKSRKKDDAGENTTGTAFNRHH